MFLISEQLNLILLQKLLSAEELLTAVQNYARECRKNHTENVYIKHPKTFLSETLPFTDYLPKKSMDKHEAPDGSNPFSEYEE